MILWLVRHGQTEDNLRGIIQGQLDTPLNETGRQQARRLAEHLKTTKFDEAWSSSLSRARETAEIVLTQQPGLTLRTDPGLMERGLGSLEGRTWPRGRKLPGDVEASDVKRITDWFIGFITSQSPLETHLDPSEASDRNVLVLSHGAYLTTLLSILLRPPFAFVTPSDLDVQAPCLNTSILKVQVRPRPVVMLYASMPTQEGAIRRLYQEALRVLEETEMEEELRSGRKTKSEWVGVVSEWGEVPHLDKGEWEDLGVADDVGDKAKG